MLYRPGPTVTGKRFLVPLLSLAKRSKLKSTFSTRMALFKFLPSLFKRRESLSGRR